MQLKDILHKIPFTKICLQNIFIENFALNDMKRKIGSP